MKPRIANKVVNKIAMINYSEACERNKAPIAAQLQQQFAHCKTVLEIGSASGQHVLHFAEIMPNITWQPSDLAPYLPGLSFNLENSPANVHTPQPLIEDSDIWLQNNSFDGLFSANTLHIMPWPQVEAFFARSGKQLKQGAKLCVYGPFNYNGEYSSPSNAEFDIWLASRQTGSGIRDIEAVTKQAKVNGFELINDIKMPANNQLLCFNKV